MGVKRKRKKRKRGRGQPTKLNASIQKELFEFIASGCSYEVAAVAAGVHRKTFHNWVKAAKAGKSWGSLSKTYMANFLHNLEIAEAQCESGAVAAWRGCIHAGDWKSAQAFLSVRHPDRWAKRSQLDLTSGGEKLQTVQVFSPRKDLTALMEEGDE